MGTSHEILHKNYHSHCIALPGNALYVLFRIDVVRHGFDPPATNGRLIDAHTDLHVRRTTT